MAIPNAAPRSGYVELERITDADGVCAILSKRVSGPPIVTIGLFKLFMRDGIEEKSTFFSHKQAEAVRRVLAIAEPRAKELELEAQTEYENRGRPGNRR